MVKVLKYGSEYEFSMNFIFSPAFIDLLIVLLKYSPAFAPLVKEYSLISPDALLIKSPAALASAALPLADSVASISPGCKALSAVPRESCTACARSEDGMPPEGLIYAAAAAALISSWAELSELCAATGAPVSISISRADVPSYSVALPSTVMVSFLPRLSALCSNSSIRSPA